MTVANKGQINRPQKMAAIEAHKLAGRGHQARIQKLIALLRLLLVVLKISRFSLNQARLPDSNDKRSLLRVC